MSDRSAFIKWAEGALPPLAKRTYREMLRVRGRLCPHCGGGHARARSAMRCHVRHLRWYRRIGRIKLVYGPPVMMMTGEAMRKFRELARQRGEHLTLTLNPRLG